MKGHIGCFTLFTLKQSVLWRCLLKRGDAGRERDLREAVKGRASLQSWFQSSSRPTAESYLLKYSTTRSYTLSFSDFFFFDAVALVKEELNTILKILADLQWLTCRSNVAVSTRDVGGDRRCNRFETFNRRSVELLFSLALSHFLKSKVASSIEDNSIDHLLKCLTWHTWHVYIFPTRGLLWPNNE